MNADTKQFQVALIVNDLLSLDVPRQPVSIAYHLVQLGYFLTVDAALQVVDRMLHGKPPGRN